MKPAGLTLSDYTSAIALAAAKFAVGPVAASRGRLRDLDRAIAKLSEKQRSAILLLGLEGMGLRGGRNDSHEAGWNRSLAAIEILQPQHVDRSGNRRVRASAVLAPATGDLTI
jgi:hypothetical protein